MKSKNVTWMWIKIVGTKIGQGRDSVSSRSKVHDDSKSPEISRYTRITTTTKQQYLITTTRNQQPRHDHQNIIGYSSDTSTTTTDHGVKDIVRNFVEPQHADSNNNNETTNATIPPPTLDEQQWEQQNTASSSSVSFLFIPGTMYRHWSYSLFQKCTFSAWVVHLRYTIPLEINPNIVP